MERHLLIHELKKQYYFQVSIDEPGQLLVTLGGAEQAYTVVGRATGTSQLVGMCLVLTSAVNTTLTIRNPASSTTALTLTPNAGGSMSVSAHLIIKRLN